MDFGTKKIALGSRFVLAVFIFITVSSAATAADYSRRIAIAPFTILGAHEDIRQTVDILPRLVSSRLMAMTGAEVLLLPPGDGPPGDAAKRAGLPLLLEGSVSKLGAGYSIDVTVTDLATGQLAGAFFAAAATEDEIILRLGDLAADISEKMFGVKAARAYAPPPVSSPAAAPPSGAPAMVPAVSSPAATPPSGGPATSPPPAPDAPETLLSGWVPSTFAKVGQSGKIADEIYGVVAGDTDSEGNREVIAYGKTTLYFYRVKGEEIVPYTRISKSIEDHILSIDAVDLDGDGGKEILVTNVNTPGGGEHVADERLASFVLKRKGDVYEEVAGKIPYFLAVLPDWMGKPVVVGQREGFDRAFRGKIFPLRWDGMGAFIAGEPFPHDTNILPLSDGLPGLSAVRFDKEWQLVYTDMESRLRVLDAGGKSQYKSRDIYGTALNFFEWGPYDEFEGKRKKYPLRMPVRVAPGGEKFPPVLIPEVIKGMLDTTQGFYKSSRLVVLQWDGGEFLEKAGTKSTGHFVTGADFLSPSGLKRGDTVVASVVEQIGSVFKDKVSRLLLFRLE